jgi:hypothetical protein
MRIRLTLLALMAACGGSETTGPTPPPGPVVATVEVTPSTTGLFGGDSLQLTATARTSAGAAVPGKAATWSSSAAGVATVSTTGIVRAVSSGQATITATIDGRTGSATVSVTVLGPPVSATIGAAGGTLSTPLSDGSTATLVVPAGALATSTLLGLEPARPAAGASATLLLRPAALAFAKPAQLQFLIPGGPPAGMIPALVYQSPSGPGHLPLYRSAVANQFVARLDRLAGPEAIASVAAGRSPWAAAADDAFLASLQNISLTALKDAARSALTAFQAGKTLPLADRLNGVMGVLAQAQPLPSFPPDGSTLLQGWRAEICAKLDQEVTLFRNLPAGSFAGFPGFFAAVNTVVAWIGIAQALENPDLALPFQGCTTDYFGPLRDQANGFADWAMADLAARQGGDLTIRFNEMLDTHIPRVLTLQAALESLGLEEFSADLTGAISRLLDALRSTAWTGCRERNDQAMLARLLDAENTGADELSAYETQDLADDAEECGTEIFWTARDDQGTAVANGKLGGTAAGQVTRSAATALPQGGTVRLTGMVRVLMCPGDVKLGVPESFNNEQLRVSAMLLPAQGVLSTRPVPTGGQVNYLHNDSLVHSTTQLRAAVNLADDLGGTVVVRLERVGLTCARGFELLPNPAKLVELHLTLEPETCVEDDLRAGAMRTGPVRAGCEEPPQPPPPPPPPGGSCPSIRIGAGGLPADSDSLTKLTCISSLLVQSADPVNLTTITAVTEAMAIRFPTTSFNAPVLSWVGATQINSGALVTLKMPVLATVAGALSITGTAISSLGEVGCPTVFGGLQISGNLNLPQAEAVAKGNCMTVHGSKSITGNKP